MISASKTSRVSVKLILTNNDQMSQRASERRAQDTFYHSYSRSQSAKLPLVKGSAERRLTPLRRHPLHPASRAELQQRLQAVKIVPEDLLPWAARGLAGLAPASTGARPQGRGLQPAKPEANPAGGQKS
jgi:hypothetical protein